MAVKRMWTAPAGILLLLLGGCSGIGTKHGIDGTPTNPDDGSVAVTVTPATTTIRVGATETFAASVSGTTNTNVTWSVNAVAGGNATAGTVDATGMYTAPANLPTPNTITVTATSAADTTKQGSGSVTLQNPIPILNSVAPTSIITGSFSLTLAGSGFVKNSMVTFGGQNLTTTYVSPTELQASGTAAATQVGTVNVIVQNPDPGCSSSSALTATVVAAAQPVSLSAAVRFLEQSTFGPTPALMGANDVGGSVCGDAGFVVRCVEYGFAGHFSEPG
ncbi:MAG: IPT/TIG domain-containing protein [Candidatus Acidiferrum sp.]